MSETKRILDFSNVVTKTELVLISTEEYLELVAEGNKENRILKGTYNFEMLKGMIKTKPLEIANNSSKNRNKSSVAKMILASEITFANQLEKIIDMLIGMHITYNHLYFICRYIIKAKQGGKRDCELEKLCLSICRLFSLHYGIANPTIILTKLSSILYYNKDDYKKAEEKYQLNQSRLKILEEKVMQEIIEGEKQR